MGGMNIWVASAIAIVGSVLANTVVYFVAKATLNIDPAFPPLASPTAPAIFTISGVGLACLVYAWMRRRGGDVNASFTRIALVVLALSMLPDIGLYVSGAPGATLGAIVVLMVMHVVAAAVTVPTLTRVES